MSWAQAEHLYDRICSTIMFLNTIGIGRLEECVRRIRRRITEGMAEDEDRTQVVRTLDNLDYVTKKLLAHLTQSARLGKQTPTRDWMSSYVEDYAEECRLVPIVQRAVRDRLGVHFLQFERAALTAALNQEILHGTPEMLADAMMACSWAHYLQTCTRSMAETWSEAMGPRVRVNMAVLFGHQHGASVKYAEELAHQLAVVDKDDERIWWQQYNRSFDDICTLTVELIEDESMGRRVTEAAATDYIDYLVARTVQDMARTGEIPHRVRSEVMWLGLETRRELLRPFTVMIKKVAAKVPKSDDPWDVTDYLEAHPWKARQELLEAAIHRIYHPETETPAEAKEMALQEQQRQAQEYL